MEPLYGVLDLLILRTLPFGPLHGYAIASSTSEWGDFVRGVAGVLTPEAGEAES